MSWKFYIDNLEIEEPIGFDELRIRIKRDENWHGVFFEASLNDLGFYGEAAAYLIDKKTNLGLAANVTFRAVWDCDLDNDFFSGRLDFRGWKKTCGDQCIVTMPVEQEGCIMTLRNRYDQKADLSKNISFNGLTVLQNYNGLNFSQELKAQELLAAIEGYSDPADIVDLDIFSLPTYDFWVRPTYTKQLYESINQGQLIPSVFAAADNGVNDSIISPVLLLDDTIDCFEGDLPYEVRLKGSYNYDVFNGGPDSVKLIVAKGEFPSSLTILHQQNLSFVGGSVVGTFDFTYSGTVALNQGDGFYVYFENLGTVPNTLLAGGSITFDPETYINITANKSCPPTNATVSLIHEAASRITETITDRCLTVKSDYYGRTDSEPYAAAIDGCGSLRVLSSGLHIRNAPNSKHFMSLKELFEGLKAIDNIGMGVEVDKLRIEPVEYFYQDIKIGQFDSIPKAQEDITEDKVYSLIRVGYKKWETESVNGLDEFNSNKEFRTSLSNVNNPLDITSGFIAGGYPIELTRQQSFASEGGGDTKYDNDTFIICVERTGYSYEVEQGNIQNGANMYSPATAYNWRIRPWYNLMRWYKSIAQAYANQGNSDSRLFFSSGAGNLLAEGELTTYDPCKLENGPKAENRDQRRTDFIEEPLPIFKPETIAFKYPFSLKDYKKLKENPYGYYLVQCGNGEQTKAFIEDIQYKPSKGEAEITLRYKWQ